VLDPEPQEAIFETRAKNLAKVELMADERRFL
jgi:hypothetical protein